MNFLRKLHQRKTPPGKEWVILRLVPKAALLGVLIPIALAVIVRVLPADPGIDNAKHIMSVDIFAIAFTITYFTILFTVALGAVIVNIMKGPAYVADAYPLQHADKPARESTRSDSRYDDTSSSSISS